MALFNIARGSIAYYVRQAVATGNPSGLQAVLFKAASQSSDGVMADFLTLAQIKGSNTEADFTGYARKTLTTLVSPGQASVQFDAVADTLSIDCDDVRWSTAGGTTNNSLGRLVFVFNPDLTASANDAGCVPLTYWPFVTTTDGTDRVAQINVAGWWKSQ